MQFIYVRDGALSHVECERVIKWFEMHPDKHRPGVAWGGEVDQSHKQSTDWTKDFREQDPVDQLLEEILIYHTKEYHEEVKGINYVSSSWNLDPYYNIQKYLPGGGFKNWHHEHGNFNEFPHSDACRRILAWMIYLNDVPDGGTQFLDQETTLKAVEGRVVIWPAYWTHTHRSQVSNTQTKYIATGWYNFDVPEL